jgi:diguanylate cyclase (GGDEF)-like protein
MAADLITGGKLLITSWLTAANLAGVLAGYLIFRLVSADDRQLGRPVSVVYLLGASIIAAAAAAIAGGGIAKVMFGRDMLDGFIFWFATELVNYVIVLPVILTSPSRFSVARISALLAHNRPTDYLPASALLCSMLLSAAVGGPGAFAYPVPALLWCALSYGLFTTAVLTFAFSVWDIVAIAAGILYFPLEQDAYLSTASERFAIALIALGPIAVANIGMARDKLIRALQHAASHDYLTNASSRGSFMRSAEEMLSGPRGRECFVLMLDIDHFKSVNDRHGHATGDRVLVIFARAVTAHLRPHDLFGRLGGEEFAIVLRRKGLAEAMASAEAIRRAVEAMEVDDDMGEGLNITVSGGISEPQDSRPGIDSLLCQADKALYVAKTAGRNRIQIARSSDPEVQPVIRQVV